MKKLLGGVLIYGQYFIVSCYQRIKENISSLTNSQAGDSIPFNTFSEMTTVPGSKPKQKQNSVSISEI